MKRLRNWIIVSLAAVVIAVLSIADIFGAHNVSAADTTLSNDSFQVIKQNALYKAIYANLVTCYRSMQPSISRNQHNAWSEFDSETYFLAEALDSQFLKYPYNVGGKNQSSCPDMITGWKTNGFINLFTGTGSYSGILGINADAVVPETSWTNGGDVDKMADFLAGNADAGTQGIGYYKVSDESTYSRYKCFYINLTPNPNFYTNATAYLPRPLSGSTFETQTFCAVVNDDGTILQDKNGIMGLTGNNDYFGNDDNGHATSSSNIVFVLFDSTDTGLAPQFSVTPESHLGSSAYLQANVSELMLRYPYHNDTTGSDREIYANTVYVQNVSNESEAEDTAYCSNHGYVWCSWWADYGTSWLYWGTHYIASLMNQNGSVTYDTFRNRMEKLMRSMYDMNGAQLFGKAEAVEFTPAEITYEKQRSNTKFLKYFLGNTTSGSSNYRSGKFTEAEKYVLYYTYLTERYNTLRTPDPSSDRVKVYWPEKDEAGNFTGNFTEQYIYNPDATNASATQYILDRDNKWDSSGLTRGNWQEIAERLGKINAISAFANADLIESVLDPELTPPASEDDTASSSSTCMKDGSSLGWILCTSLELMGNAVNGIYDDIANNWMEIGTDEMKADDSNGVYEAWKGFRDFANIVFVIFLLVVIFSQVTGLGLTNYGIKKVLPTLIMVAILVNISFILCQVAVDATNILGDGLRHVFEGIKIAGKDDVGLSNIIKSIGGAILGLNIIGGVAALGIVMPEYVGALLVPFLLALIAALVGVVMFYLSLAIRKAGILALVILCPVAIICYALPNTKKFFSRWLGIFTALLTVYPICSVLMGGGKFFSQVLLTTAKDDSGNVGFMMALTAMLIQVVPFFFIPTLITRSLNAIGAIGAKLTGFKSRLSHGAQGLLRGSRWAQDRQQRVARNIDMNRSRRLQNTWKGRADKLREKQKRLGSKFSKIDQNRLNRANYEFARARARSDRATIEEMQNTVTAGREALEPGTARYNNVMDKLINAANDEETEELRNSLINRHMSYSDSGNTYDVDANTIGDIKADGTLDTAKDGALNSESAALLHYMHKYDANPSDKSALTHIRAITKQMLDAGGDAGQRSVANALRGYTSAAGGNSTRTQSFNDLTDYISRNGKWMAQFKATDRGAHTLISDGASSTAELKKDFEYNIAGGYAPDMVPGLSDGAFDAIDLEIEKAKASGAMRQEVKDNILKLNSTLEEAYDDPRIAARIKPSVTTRANAVHETAYKLERQSWLASVDNIKKYLSGRNSEGNVIKANGMVTWADGKRYLVDDKGNRLKRLDRSGFLTAEEAYRTQIKAYHALKKNTAPADMHVPH